MNELGYDEAIIRGAGPLTEQLAKAAPEGIDVFFDNVGGEQLQAAVEAARPGAGSSRSAPWPGSSPSTAPVPRHPSSWTPCRSSAKRIVMRGFSSDDFDDESEWTERFAA